MGEERDGTDDREPTRLGARRARIVAGLLALALGALQLIGAAPVEGATALSVSPSAGPIGSSILVTGSPNCDTIANGQPVGLKLVALDTDLQTSAFLGDTTIHGDGTISQQVTVPATAKELRLGDGIYDVPLTPGSWQVEPGCSSDGAPAGGAPFTVTDAPVSTTSSSTTTTPPVTAPPPPPSTSTSITAPTSTSTSTSTTSTSAPTSTSSSTSTTATAPTSTSTTATATTTTGTIAATPGTTTTFSGTGFAPGSDIDLTFESTPVSLGRVTADSRGAFSTRVTIPADAPVGSHHLVARGTDATGAPHTVSTAVTVTASSLPRTGTELPTSIAAGLLLLAFGALLLRPGAPGEDRRRALR